MSETDKFSFSPNFVSADTRLTPMDSAAAILTTPTGELLLQLRDDKATIFFPNHWGCFGGAIDPGESYHTTLLRELHEELGVAFDGTRIDTTPRFSITFTPKPGDARVITRHYFVVEISEQGKTELRLGEGRDLRFFTPEQVLTIPNASPYDKFALWLYLNHHRLNA